MKIFEMFECIVLYLHVCSSKYLYNIIKNRCAIEYVQKCLKMKNQKKKKMR